MEIHIHTLLRNITDTQQVLLCFSRQTDHQIEFHAGPTTGKCVSNLFDQIFFRDALIDYVTKALRSSLYSESQACLLGFLCLLKGFFHKTVNSQRRKRYADMLALELPHNGADQIRQACIVTAGQA